MQYYPDSVCRSFYVPLTIELKKQLLFKEDDCLSYDYTEKIDADIIFDKHDIIRQYDLRDTEGSLVYRAFCDTEGYITNDDPNSMAVNCYIEKSGSIYNKDTIYIERGDTISLVELRILNFNKYSISLKLEYIVSPESTANSYKNTNIPVIVDRKELSKYRILNKIHFKEKGTFQFIDKGTLSLRDSIVKKYNSYSPIIIVKWAYSEKIAFLCYLKIHIKIFKKIKYYTYSGYLVRGWDDPKRPHSNTPSKTNPDAKEK